jgi:preprotein translocase subunit Sss1
MLSEVEASLFFPREERFLDVTLQPDEEEFAEILQKTRFFAGFWEKYAHNSMA